MKTNGVLKLVFSNVLELGGKRTDKSMPSTENKTRHMAVTEEDLANVKLLKDGKKFGNFILFYL